MWVLVQGMPSPGVHSPWVPLGAQTAAVRGTHPAGLQERGTLRVGGTAGGGAGAALCPLIPAPCPQPEQEALGAGSPAFGDEEEEKDLNKALGVERFEEILNDAHPRNAEEAGRSYGEEDFECERGQGRARSRERAGSGQGAIRERGTGRKWAGSTAPTPSPPRPPAVVPPHPPPALHAPAP